MRAFVVTGPESGAVYEVEAPAAGPGEVVVDVHRVGVCGTDVEFWTGRMAYLHSGAAAYPMRLGHEWCGEIAAVADDVDPAWLGRRVTADTMLGCGHCARCLGGRGHVCADRFEIGIRGGFPGALAEQIAVPASALVPLPDAVDDSAGALVEPGGNAVRCVRAADLRPGERLLVFGAGTIGSLVAGFATAAGVEVHLVGPPGHPPAAAGSARVWTVDALPDVAWHGVVDCTFGAEIPALALEMVEPGRRVVYIGLAGEPSPVDSRTTVLKDLTVVGILGASAGLAGAVEAYASGTVEPRSLVAATVGLNRTGAVLSGWRPNGAGPGPKVHVDPRR